MSRSIDLTKPLSEADREYLVARCRWRDLQTADANAEVPEQPSNPPLTTQDSRPDANPTDNGTLTADLPTTPLPDVSGATEAEEEEGDNYDDESVWSYADLQTEAKSREGIAANQSREDLIAALRKDDESGN